MLAQIKSSDDDVWTSLNKSGHIQGEPSDSLRVRLSRMRNWIGGPHFPENSRVKIRNEIGDEAKEQIGDEGIFFLNELASLLSECEWNDARIGGAISEACDSRGISRKEGDAAIYWAMIGRRYGPKASSLIF